MRLRAHRDSQGRQVWRWPFFNATTRTAEGYVGFIFRRPPFLKIPNAKFGQAVALAEFSNDANLLGTPLVSYAKNVVGAMPGRITMSPP